jgi:hypothetical protein
MSERDGGEERRVASPGTQLVVVGLIVGATSLADVGLGSGVMAVVEEMVVRR